MDSTSWSKNHRVGQPAVHWGHPGVGPWNVAKNPHSESQNLWFIWFSGAVLSQVGHLQIGGVCVLLTSATALAGFSGEAAFDAGTVRFKTAAAEIWKDEETCFSRWRHSIFSWPSQVVVWTWVLPSRHNAFCNRHIVSCFSSAAWLRKWSKHLWWTESQVRGQGATIFSVNRNGPVAV